MTKLRTLLAGAFVALALCGGYALAQVTISPNTLTGNEAWVCAVGGPGGPSTFCTTNLMRNSSGYQLVATGGTVNTTVPQTTGKLIATGAITTWNVTLPASPFDGETVAIACPGGTATVAVTANAVPASTTISGTAFTACTAGGAAANTAEWLYSLSANVWERIQ